jgi:hypothetical protein
MRRKVIFVLAIMLAFAFGTTALAATADGVQALWRQVGEELGALRGKTLTESQQETLKAVQDEYFKLIRNDNTTHVRDTEREEKITSFMASLSESQKTAFDEFMPKMPAGEPTGGNKPNGMPPARPEGEDYNGERPAPPSGAKPAGTPARPDGTAFPASPPSAGMPQGERPEGGAGFAMTDEEREAMKEKREAFIATLSEAQKEAYEDIFPADMEGGEGRMFPMAEIDLSALTSSELANMEGRLNSMLTKLKQLK